MLISLGAKIFLKNKINFFISLILTFHPFHWLSGLYFLMVSTVKCIFSLYFGKFLKTMWVFNWFPLNISNMKYTYACYIIKILLTQNAETKIEFKEEWNIFKCSSHLEIRTDQDCLISYINLWSIFHIAKKSMLISLDAKNFQKVKWFFY